MLQPWLLPVLERNNLGALNSSINESVTWGAPRLANSSKLGLDFPATLAYGFVSGQVGAHLSDAMCSIQDSNCGRLRAMMAEMNVIA